MTDEPGTKQFEAELADERWRLLLVNLRTSTLPTLLVSLILAGFYTLYVALPMVWAWWLALAVVIGLRTWLLTGREWEQGRTRLDLLLLATGVLWGGAPLLVAYYTDPAQAFTAILLAAGIAIAAFGAYGVDTRSAALVTLPIGAGILLVTAGSELRAYHSISIAVPLLYAHQFLVMKQARESLERQIRLRVENSALVERLSEQADKTAAELDRRLETERMLRASRDRAERMSATDSMTGIANRRYFDKRLASEVSRAFRDRSNLSLVLCDVDFFKQYNDHYGHQQGDECLKQFAAILDSFCRRGGDLAARVGGEEFALLLPTTEHEAARSLAEQARRAFDEAGILHAGSKVSDNATASFGVATLVPDGLDAATTIYKRADDALYSAKENGRNRVVSETEMERLNEEEQAALASSA